MTVWRDNTENLDLVKDTLTKALERVYMRELTPYLTVSTYSLLDGLSGVRLTSLRGLTGIIWEPRRIVSTARIPISLEWWSV